MADVYDAVWPEGLVRSLWNFQALSPEAERTIPFMGIAFDGWFFIYFLLGGVVIAAFAFQRFNERFTDGGPQDWRVLQTLTPKALRGRSSIRRAYGYYLSILLVIYTVLTFFGGLIAKIFSDFTVAGVQIETGNLDFENHAWPIALSAGFAGLGPMLPPIAALELRLRRWAHRTVGIPVRVMQRTDEVLHHLDQAGDRVDISGNSSPKQLAPVETVPNDEGKVGHWKVKDGPGNQWIEVRPWVRTHLDSFTRLNELLETRLQLRTLLEWRDVRGTRWPRPGVREDLEDLETTIAREAEVALSEFDKIIETPFVPADFNAEEVDGKDRNKLQMHQQGLKQSLDAHRDKLVELRRDLAAILALYAERDPNFSAIPMDPSEEADPGLEALSAKSRDVADAEDHRRVLAATLAKVFKPQPPDGNPQALMAAALLILVLPAFLWATFAQVNSLLGSVDRTALTVWMTALIETLRIAILFLLPVAIAFSWRYHKLERKDGERWRHLRRGQLDRAQVMQLAQCVGMALVVTALALAGLAVLWASLLATDTGHFVRILLTDSHTIYYYVGQIVVSAAFLVAALFAADAGRGGDPTRRRATFSWNAALLVAVAWLAHLALWRMANGWGSCTGGGDYFVDVFRNGACFQRYGFTGLIVAFVMAGLSAGLFVAAPHVAPSSRSSNTDRRPSGWFDSRRNQGAGVAILALALLWPAGGTAQGGGDSYDEPVVLGFRADAAPFSYRTKMTDHRSPEDAAVLSGGRMKGANRYHYRGFIADLCHWIFAEGPYEIRQVEVTPSQRLETFRVPDGWDGAWPRASRAGTTVSARAAASASDGGDGADDEITGIDEVVVAEPGSVDVLCDPMTLRYHADDESARPYALYSPIVFVSGVSYLHRRGGQLGGDVLLGYVSHTTAIEVAERACRTNKFAIAADNFEAGCDPHDFPPSPSSEARASSEQAEGGDVQSWQAETAGTTAAPEHECFPFAPSVEDIQGGDAEKPEFAYQLCPFGDHGDLIDWFCSDDATDFGLDEAAATGRAARERVYFGDIDIIRAKLRQKQQDVPCKGVQETSQTFTYEPYALAVTADRPHLFAFVQRRVYEYFSHRGHPIGKFSTYFEERMSQPLAWLFLLHAVDHRDHFTAANGPAELARDTRSGTDSRSDGVTVLTGGLPETSERRGQVTGTRVNLRAGPDASAASVGLVSRGDLLHIAGDPLDGWARVRHPTRDASAWIWSEYLSDVTD